MDFLSNKKKSNKPSEKDMYKEEYNSPVVPDSLKKAASEIISELEKPVSKKIDSDSPHLSNIASPQKNFKEDILKKNTNVKIPKINLVDIPVKKRNILKSTEPQITKKKSLFPKDSLIKKTNANIIQNIRTYKNDIANELKKQKTSVVSMVMAEKKKKGNTKSKITAKKHFRFSRGFVFALFFVFILVFGGFFIKNQTKKQGTKITEIKIPTFIFPDYQRELFLKKIRKNNIIEKINEIKKNISIPLGSIIQIYITEKDPSKKFFVEGLTGNKLLLDTNTFLTGLETKSPASLIRSFNPKFILGFHSSLGNNIFLLFKLNSYENAFAGMLKWEKTGLFKDLYPLFKKEGIKINPDEAVFKDIVVKNKDVRAILDKKGKIEFAYSFPNKETLVVVNNETTLEELFRRVRTVGLERNN